MDLPLEREKIYGEILINDRWLKGDKPWQILATCIEITNAIRSGNPDTYPSRLPVHQDGSCNGLQHYSALGGDTEGARMVNLSSMGDTNKPAVY